LFDFGYELSDKTKLYRYSEKYKIKIPDAIIASTAIVYNIPLITSGKGFDKSKEIDLLYIQK
jgi:predicted nucleic acid-binding protein